jgi:hypothetical protein
MTLCHALHQKFGALAFTLENTVRDIGPAPLSYRETVY